MAKEYAVIKRYGEHLGLFSYVITNLGNIDKALKKGRIPIIDMQSYKNPYLEEEEVGIKNAWEFFFEQPCNKKLEDIKGEKQIEITSVTRNRPNDSMRFFLNKKVNAYWKERAKKYLRLNKTMQIEIEHQEKKIFKGHKEKILGVLCRGTDYVSLKPFRHPVQPTPEEVIEKAKEVMKEQKCKKIFLATEDESILKKFQKEFGDNLLFLDQKRFQDTKEHYLAEINFNRNHDAYLKGIEYLSTIVLLSKCDSFIGGRCSGTIGVTLFADHFDYTYFWDKGRYKFPKFPSFYRQK